MTCVKECNLTHINRPVFNKTTCVWIYRHASPAQQTHAYKQTVKSNKHHLFVLDFKENKQMFSYKHSVRINTANIIELQQFTTKWKGLLWRKSGKKWSFYMETVCKIIFFYLVCIHLPFLSSGCAKSFYNTALKVYGSVKEITHFLSDTLLSCTVMRRPPSG